MHRTAKPACSFSKPRLNGSRRKNNVLPVATHAARQFRHSSKCEPGLLYGVGLACTERTKRKVELFKLRRTAELACQSGVFLTADCPAMLQLRRLPDSHGGRDRPGAPSSPLTPRSAVHITLSQPLAR